MQAYPQWVCCQDEPGEAYLQIYNTAQQRSKGLLLVFSFSLDFNGISYNGGHSRNEKEAKQFAALTVVISLLGIFLLYNY